MQEKSEIILKFVMIPLGYKLERALISFDCLLGNAEPFRFATGGRKPFNDFEYCWSGSKVLFIFIKLLIWNKLKRL